MFNMKQVSKTYESLNLRNIQAVTDLLRALENLEDTDVGDYQTAKYILQTRPDLATQFKLILKDEYDN